MPAGRRTTSENSVSCRSRSCLRATRRTETALAPLSQYVDGMLAGNAADRDLLERAGILCARSVPLTTNDDAMNIYLAVFCRRLNHDLRIVSRIAHHRNLETNHRAGADFVLSYTTLGIEVAMSVLGGTRRCCSAKAWSCSSFRCRPHSPENRCETEASDLRRGAECGRAPAGRGSQQHADVGDGVAW